MDESQNRNAVAFEEFKLYFETAEKVTDRRNELNRMNTSLCTLILAAIGVIVAWAYEASNRTAIPIAVTLAAFISILGILFTRYWLRQIESYKALNGAKFAVLEEMASRLVFTTDSQSETPSYQPLQREWEMLRKRGALKVIRGKEVMKASANEFTIPQSFSFLFVFVLAICIVLVFSHVQFGDATKLLTYITVRP